MRRMFPKLKMKTALQHKKVSDQDCAYPKTESLYNDLY